MATPKGGAGHVESKGEGGHPDGGQGTPRRLYIGHTESGGGLVGEGEERTLDLKRVPWGTSHSPRDASALSSLSGMFT